MPTRAHAPQEEASRGTNGYAIASIVLGVLAIVFWLPLVGSVLLLGA